MYFSVFCGENRGEGSTADVTDTGFFRHGSAQMGMDSIRVHPCLAKRVSVPAVVLPHTPGTMEHTEGSGRSERTRQARPSRFVATSLSSTIKLENFQTPLDLTENPPTGYNFAMSRKLEKA